MIVPFIATLTLLSTQGNTPKFHCINAAQGAEYDKPSEIVDYQGIRYGTCCPGCADAFAKDPQANLKAEHEKGWLLGTSLFDPISHERITQEKSKATSTYNGIVYYFASDDEKTTFDAMPKKYTHMPKKEVLTCAVFKTPIKTMADAFGYVDYKGVRYYVCCDDCLPKMMADPAKYAPGVADDIKEAAPEKVTATSDGMKM